MEFRGGAPPAQLHQLYLFLPMHPPISCLCPSACPLAHTYPLSTNSTYLNLSTLLSPTRYIHSLSRSTCSYPCTHPSAAQILPVCLSTSTYPTQLIPAARHITLTSCLCFTCSYPCTHHPSAAHVPALCLPTPLSNLRVF